MYRRLITLAVTTAPVMVLANEACKSASIKNVLAKFLNAIVTPIITLLFAAALLFFFWGLFKMIMALSAGESAADGKQHMLWGLVGMVIMFSAIGIISVVSNSVDASVASCLKIQGSF